MNITTSHCITLLHGVIGVYHVCGGPCIITAIWRCRKSFSQWGAVFIESCVATGWKHRDSIRWCSNGPLARYVKLRVALAPGMPGTYSTPPRVSDPDMHHGTCVTHAFVFSSDCHRRSLDFSVLSLAPCVGWHDIWLHLCICCRITGEPIVNHMNSTTKGLYRYIKLRVAHAPGMPGAFSPPQTSMKTAS